MISIQLDIMSFFQPVAPCSFSMPFLTAFYAHMALLPVIFLSLKFSEKLTDCVKKKKKHHVDVKSLKFQLLFIFLLYPGVGQRVFQVFDCQNISGRFFLRADYSVECFQGEHFYALIVAFICLGVYVIGIPLGFFLYLRKNRKHLAKPTFAEKFGGLYIAYTASAYWFETFEMIKKIILVGGIVLVDPGSTSQILLGFLVAFTFYTVVFETI